ncbi:MAG: DUF5312 domain-containing protein [Treponema sp.]|jgi:hypothetical protein|nr:DUF5312 domain-containing protein [Treponema sp.]
MSFLDSLFSLFGGGTDPASIKKRQMGQLVKNMHGNKYGKFYRPKTEQVDPALAKFFWDMYKVVSPAQVFMQNAAKSAQLKQIVIDSFLDKPALELRRRLSPEAIDEASQKTVPKELARQLRQASSELTASFDSHRIALIDGCYNLIMTFMQFVNFDFFFMLKKFDPKMPERSFSKVPNFAPLRADMVKEELKDFLEAAQGIDPDQDWKTVLKVLKTYKGDMDVVAPEQWSRLLQQLRDLRRSLMLELMIRHIEKNPGWLSKPKIPDEHIAAPFLDSMRQEVEQTIETIVNSKRNAQISELAINVFGRPDINRLKYYTEKGGEIYARKNFDGFLHVRGMNYLKAFLLDYFKKDIRELCDLLLIRGQWMSTSLSQQLSDGFHNVMALSEEIITFDEALGDKGSHGSRLKAAIVKADRDKGQAKYVRIILNTVNEEAHGAILKGAQNFIIIAKNFKGVLEDCKKNPRELIMNWKELEAASEIPLIQRLAECYKKIYFFVQILQLLIQSGQEEA